MAVQEVPAGGDLPAIPVLRAPGPCMRQRCSDCCHAIEMILTEADVERLRAARPGVEFFFRAPDGYLQLRTRDGPPVGDAEGRPCVFLGQDGQCTVHAVRPEGCRLYPAVWDEGLAEVVLDGDYCPHTEGFVLDRETAEAVRRLAARLEEERRGRSEP